MISCPQTNFKSGKVYEIADEPDVLAAIKVGNDSEALAALQKKLRGNGKATSEGNGMTSDEIDDLMKRYKPRFLGTIARDQWEDLTPPVDAGKSGWIMNTTHSPSQASIGLHF